MKILFVTDELPFPPRNGRTIPIFNYMSRLSALHEVHLLFYEDDERSVEQQQLAANEPYVHKLWKLKRRRKPKIVRILNELRMQSCFFHQTYSAEQLSKCLCGQSYDIVFIDCFNNINVIDECLDVLGYKPLYVAAVSDSVTAMFRNRGQRCFLKGLPFKTRLHYAIAWFRSWLIARIEARMLQQFDLILVQTTIELKWLNVISHGALNSKIMILPNGVNEVLFKIPINSDRRDIMFAAALDGEYKDVAIWIIENVWDIIKSHRSDVRFFVTGRNAPLFLLQKMKQDEMIVHTEYVPDIADMYVDKAIMLAPVFKTYGIINRVLESMAAGVPVIGDAGSFNAIPGFRNGYHGIITKDAAGMAKSVLDLLRSPERRSDIAHSARELIKQHFSWDNSFANLANRLALLISQKEKMANEEVLHGSFCHFDKECTLVRKKYEES